jgi:hypothetical protein
MGPALTDARIVAGSSSSTLFSKSLDSRTIPASRARDGEFSMAWLKVTDFGWRCGEYMEKRAGNDGAMGCELSGVAGNRQLKTTHNIAALNGI